MRRYRYLYRPPPANHPLSLSAPQAPSGIQIAPSSDLRAFLLPPRDQGQEGCCSGFSTAALREYLHNAALGIYPGSPIPLGPYLSPAYLYARTRMSEGTFPKDAGATVADEMLTLQNYGVCLETDLPYTADPTEAPTPQDDTQAVPFRCGTPQVVPRSDPQFIKAVLSAGRPVVFGTPVYQSFEDTKADGIVAVPDTGREQLLGGHAMLCCGHNDESGYFLVRNSWGLSWGFGGYCFIRYDQCLTWFEAWTAPIAI